MWNLPLIGRGVDRVGVHRDAGEEVVEEAQQAGIPRAECLLQKRRRCHAQISFFFFLSLLSDTGRKTKIHPRKGHTLFAPSRHCFSSVWPRDPQNVELGLSSRSCGRTPTGQSDAHMGEPGCEFKGDHGDRIYESSPSSPRRGTRPGTQGPFCASTLSPGCRPDYGARRERGFFLECMGGGMWVWLVTLMQALVRSSIREVSRAHSALVHCGAVRFVGSMRTRDLYAREDGADSVRGRQSTGPAPKQR